MRLLPISHLEQRQQADCLAACSAMLLDYLQVSIKYKKLVKRLRIGYGGAPFRNLHDLEAFGVSVEIKQGEIETLRAKSLIYSPRVCCAHWGAATSTGIYP